MRKKIIITLGLFLFLSAINTQSFAQSQDIQRYSAYYSNGVEYLKHQQFSSAISEFRKVLRFSPYDETIQNAIANAYLARGQYYKQTTKELKKALNDFKSACFYSKYWQNGQSESLTQLANNSLKEINDIEKKLSVTQDFQTRLQSAKTLKAQGELAASGYDFQILKNSQHKEIAYENLANIYKNLNNLANAMDYIKTAIDINPKNPKLHFLYGVMLDNAQNYEASMEQYNLALQYGDKSPELMEILENKWTQGVVNNPQDAQGYVNLGAIYQKQGNLEAAKTQYLKAYQLNSSDETILYNLASLYVQQKNHQGALGIYDKLLAINPNKIDIVKYKATALEELMRYDEALEQYEKILALEPNNSEIKAKCENIILNNFSGEKLKNYLIAKANSTPQSYEAQFNCAYEFHKNKDYDNAIEYYNRALNLNPGKEEVYLNLAQIYIEQKNYALASQTCQKGLLVLPQSKKINQILADAKNYSASSKYIEATKLYDQGQYKQSLSAFLQIQEKTKEVNMAIANCYWQMKDYQNANKYYNDVLIQEPNNLDALISSAWAYYSTNDYTNAKMMASKALMYDKANKDAKDILNSIYETEYSTLLNDAIAKYEQGEYNLSLSILNKYLTQKPDDEYALYYKGLNFDELKKPQEAMKQYKQLISKSPNFAAAYYSLALAYDNSENYSEAVKNYEQFLKLKQGENDEMTNFSASRSKELKEYLNQINGNKK